MGTKFFLFIHVSTGRDHEGRDTIKRGVCLGLRARPLMNGARWERSRNSYAAENSDNDVDLARALAISMQREVAHKETPPEP